MKVTKHTSCLPWFFDQKTRQLQDKSFCCPKHQESTKITTNTYGKSRVAGQGYIKQTRILDNLFINSGNNKLSEEGVAGELVQKVLHAKSCWEGIDQVTPLDLIACRRIIRLDVRWFLVKFDVFVTTRSFGRIELFGHLLVSFRLSLCLSMIHLLSVQSICFWLRKSWLCRRAIGDRMRC